MSGRHTNVVIEADGGSRGNPGPAGYGSVLKDSDTGEVIAEAAESIGHATNNVAEYRGLIAGLELYVEHAPDAQLEVRMDSKLVIEQMAGRWKIKHPAMRPLAVTAQSLAPFGTVWTWVPRDQNTHADRLANLAMDRALGARPKAAPRAVAPGQVAPGEDGGNSPGDPTPEAPEPPTATSQLIGWLSGEDEVTTVILLRHGVTRFTVEKRFSGAGAADDPGLTDEGRAQASRAADLVRSLGEVEAILSSPLRRARETADAVATALALSIDLAPDFSECAFGEWDGLTFEDVMARWPGNLEEWLGSVDVRPPGGESLIDVQQRVEAELRTMIEKHRGQTILVVSHVTPIKLAVRLALDIPLLAINRMQLAPAALSTLSFYESGASTLRQFSAVP